MSESRVRENRTHGLMRRRWRLATDLLYQCTVHNGEDFSTLLYEKSLIIIFSGFATLKKLWLIISHALQTPNFFRSISGEKISFIVNCELCIKKRLENSLLIKIASQFLFRVSWSILIISELAVQNLYNYYPHYSL